MCARLVELGREPPKLSPEHLHPHQTKRDTYNVTSSSPDTMKGLQESMPQVAPMSSAGHWTEHAQYTVHLCSMKKLFVHI